jgi:hypothetical protein
MSDHPERPPVQRTPEGGHPHPLALLEVCGLPEFAPLLAGWSLDVGLPDGGLPFVVTSDRIQMAPSVATDPTLAALHLREALELAELERDDRSDDEAVAFAYRMLAHLTAVAYVGIVSAADGIDASIVPPQSLDVARRVHTRAAAPATRPHAADLSRRLADALLERGTDIHPDATTIERAVRLAGPALELALPTNILLSVGGDDRQAIDWSTGRNPYGVSLRPTPWVASFSSCTASSPTERSYGAASALRRRLLRASLEGRRATVLAAEWRTIRERLGAALGLRAAGASVVPTPSGTDAEYVALLAVVCGAAGTPVTTVVVAPREVGSGTLSAARGRHFSLHTPLGGAVDTRIAVNPFRGLDIDASTVSVRENDGSLRATSAVDADVTAAADAAVAAGRHVLVHLVDGSKTGIRLPSTACVEDLQARHGDRVAVLVDAAQMRVDQATVRSHVEAGRMVIVTGSKFFAGPPFSGAVILPRVHADRLSAATPRPNLGDHLDSASLPPELTHLGASHAANLGLVLRWEAALDEMGSFLSLSPALRDEILRELAVQLRRVVLETPGVELVVSPYTREPTSDDVGLDDLPTIFTFAVIDPRTTTPVDAARLALVHRLVRIDLRDELSPTLDRATRELAGREFDLGQPVRVGGSDDDPLVALRIAFGAPTLTRIVFDHTRGRDWRARLEREVADARDALAKVALVVDHLEVIPPAAPYPGPRTTATVGPPG